MIKKLTKFYLFGDSICFGQMITSHNTWASAFAKHLEELGTKREKFIIQNAGVNGNTTRQALERMYYDVTSHSPDYVLVQFGINDCNYWASDKGVARVSQKAFIANIEEIVEKALMAGSKHCFINTNHPINKGEFNYQSDNICKTYDESNLEYNQLIRGSFNSMRRNSFPVTLIDIEKSWNNYLKKFDNIELSDLLLKDGVHLSELGHNLYFNTITPKILKQLTNK